MNLFLLKVIISKILVKIGDHMFSTFFFFYLDPLKTQISVSDKTNLPYFPFYP